MTPSSIPESPEQALLPARNQTLNVLITFSFARTPVEPGARPAAKDLQQVGKVRRICGVKLRDRGFEQCIDPALLLLSELVTNAIRHGSGHTIGVRLSCTPNEVRIEVWGGLVSALTTGAPDPTDENGRGLLLVDAIADAWGVDDGGWVWCTVMTNSEWS